MYNRYIPQSDGSFRRNRVPDQAPCPSQPVPPEPPPEQSAVCSIQPPIQPCSSSRPPRRPGTPKRKSPSPPSSSGQDRGIGGFFKQLLPRDFDTEDLLIVLLLLLMSSDCPEDKNTALLTLALYLFL